MKSHPLKVERERRGWSQSKVADLLGTTTRSIIRWEQGDVTPYPYYREQLCTIFGKTAQELGLASTSPVQDPYEDEDEESIQLELELPPETSMSLPASRLPQEEFLLDPIIPEMLGRSESLLGRDLLLAQIKRRLLEADSPPLTALYGLPGIGKTALAVASAFDRQIQARFHDGILWAELGPQPNVLGQLARWATLLGVPPSQVANLQSREAWGKALQAAIGHRNLLLVIDDAWTAQDALAFRVGGPHCSHLLTTRLPQVAFVFAGEGVISVPELQDVDGLALLARFVPQFIEQDPEGAQALVSATGGLPLGLVLIGKYLAVHALSQQPRRLQAALAQIHNTKQRLQVSAPIAPGERTANLPADILPSLYATIAVSDQRLSPQAHDALRALATFPPKPASFSEEAALAVIQQPVEILDELWDAGLLENCGASRYSLHQTVVDYARALSEDPTAQEQQADSLASTIHPGEQETHALIASPSSFSSRRFPWKVAFQKEGRLTFRPSKPSLPHPWLMISLILLATVIISVTLSQVSIRLPFSASSTLPKIPTVQANYSPPTYLLLLDSKNTDPSLNDIVEHLQIAFRAVYPQLVNRFALDPASTPENAVTLTLASDLSSPATTNGTTISISTDWLREHPTQIGLLTHELTLMVQAYPPGAPRWFSDGMADYARSLYGPADDDDWSLPEHVQPQDSYMQGGAVAARFLVWLEQHTRLDIVDQLNHALQTRQSFSAAFHRLTHHSVDELWTQYQADPNIALTPQQLYKTAISRKPLFYQSSADIECFQCPSAGWFRSSTLPGLFMSNFTIQANMTFVKSDGGGGFFFRYDTYHGSNKYYRFHVGPDGTYDMINQTQANQSMVMASSVSSAVKQGLHQTNQLTIIAQKHTIYVYINGQFLLRIDDSTSSYGEIGVTSVRGNNPIAESHFDNIQVF